ncbi:hypothetical protein XPA_000978 [Xanthoria parietina]
MEDKGTSGPKSLGKSTHRLQPVVSKSFFSGRGEKHKGPLRIEKSGRKIPQEAVLDLKTRAGWKRDLNVLEDQLPRYWVAQIPNLILARDDGGVFNNIKDLRRLVWLLREIIAAEKVRKDRKLEVRCKSLDALELREQDTDEHDVLPPELKLR